LNAPASRRWSALPTIERTRARRGTVVDQLLRFDGFWQRAVTTPDRTPAIRSRHRTSLIRVIRWSTARRRRGSAASHAHPLTRARVTGTLRGDSPPPVGCSVDSTSAAPAGGKNSGSGSSRGRRVERLVTGPMIAPATSSLLEEKTPRGGGGAVAWRLWRCRAHDGASTGGRALNAQR